MTSPKHSMAMTDDLSLKQLALKQCVLSMVAILCTLLTLVSLIVFGDGVYYMVISTDYMVSSLCIILMYSWNSKVLRSVCCCLCNCYRCCRRRSIKRMDSTPLSPRDVSGHPMQLAS